MNLVTQLFIYRVFIVVIGILLFAAGIVDMKRKQISRGMILLLMLVCCAVIPFKKDFNIIDAAGGLTIGLCAIGVSLATREQIGKGDGLVIAAVGLALGAHKCILVVCIASFAMCVAAIIVLLFRKGNRQTRLPFLPAVFAGYLLCFIL